MVTAAQMILDDKGNSDDSCEFPADDESHSDHADQVEPDQIAESGSLSEQENLSSDEEIEEPTPKRRVRGDNKNNREVEEPRVLQF